MIPTHVLDGLLTVVVGVWAILSIAIVVDRYRHDRRTRRLEREVRNAPGGAGVPHGLAGRITPAEFQELALAGLPRHVEYAIADELCTRLGGRQLRMLADGARPADIRSRIAALHILISSRHADMYYALDRCVRSGVRDLAAAAVRMLIGVDTRDAAGILIAALCDDAHTASRLAAAIDRMTAPRADLLAPLLEHDSAVPRFWGARLAGRLLAYDWAPVVRKLTADPDPLVRRAAVETLGAIGEPKDRVLLMIRFLDPAPMVRVHAARASAAFQDPAVADALTELLRDREWIVRAAARDALRRLGPTGAAAAMRTLWEEDPFAANSAAEVLFLTGAAVTMARGLLRRPDDDHVLAIVTQFLAAAGPHLERALLEQLGASDADRFLALVREGAPMGDSGR